MSWHAPKKRLGGLFSSRRQQSPSSSQAGRPSASATGAAEPGEKAQGRLHRAAARSDQAWLGLWHRCFKTVGIDRRDQQRRTPLYLASANGCVDVVRPLAGRNCQMNLADDLKRTPLMKAVQCQQEECVAILLEHGADPNLADVDGNTALHLAVLCGNTTVAGLLLEHNASTNAQNQGGYTPLNLAVSKHHKEMLECLLKKAGDRHAAEQCERTALEVAKNDEADVEKDNLHLQEELQRIKVKLWEVEKKTLNSERCVQNLMIVLDEKEREELSAVQELQDQLSAYLENQTTVKQLEEHVQRLEIQKARLEATVHQQNDKIEDLQRDLQASASLQEMEEKYLNSERCVRNLMAVLVENERESTASTLKLQDQLSIFLETVKQLEEHVQCLEIQKARLEATVHQQNDKIEDLQRDLQASASEVEKMYLNSEHCVQNLRATLDEKEGELTASSLKLQDQLSIFLETVKKLEEHVQCLGFEKTRLEATVEQHNNKIEALQIDLQATTSAQAAIQDSIKQGASHHESVTNQLKDRIRDLEYELDRIKDTQQENTVQKQCTQAEVEKYKELYLQEVKISKWQAKELERANERLEEANAKLVRERHKNKSLITSSIVSGGLAATPVLYSTALGHLGNNLGLNRSLSLGGSFLSQCEKILSSRNRLAASMAKVQQELDEKITKELKEATAELETGFAGSSKKFHLHQDPLCRAIEEYCDV